MFFMSKLPIVARRRRCQLATTAPVLTARGKPSTWFPRGRLVEQSRQDKTQKRRQKARTEKKKTQQQRLHTKNLEFKTVNLVSGRGTRNTGPIVSFAIKYVF